MTIEIPEEHLEQYEEARRIVQAHISSTDALAQLAEEASELAQAALKLRRCFVGTNPTPVKPKDAIAHVREEVADVVVCLDVLAPTLPPLDERPVATEKMTRWAQRLTEARPDWEPIKSVVLDMGGRHES